MWILKRFLNPYIFQNKSSFVQQDGVAENSGDGKWRNFIEKRNWKRCKLILVVQKQPAQEFFGQAHMVFTLDINLDVTFVGTIPIFR